MKSFRSWTEHRIIQLFYSWPKKNKKLKKKKENYLERALEDLFKYLLLCPEDVNLWAGPGCAFVLKPFSTLFAFPFLPLTLTQMMLPVLPIIMPPVHYIIIFDVNSYIFSSFTNVSSDRPPHIRYEWDKCENKDWIKFFRIKFIGIFKVWL